MTTSERVRSGPLIAVLASAGVLGALTQTLVVPLIAELPAIFDTTPSNASWIITVTLLTGAVSTTVIGRLGDLYGKRKILLISAAPLIVGSIVCALSASVLPMIVGRGLQGLSTGMIPLAISLLHDVLPHDRVHGGVALMSASMGIGAALGLPLAAAVAQYANWRVLFWLVALLAPSRQS